MNARRPSQRVLTECTDAVVSFALDSLQPNYLRWNKTINMGMAQMVWNSKGDGIHVGGELSRDSAFDEMIRELTTVRRTQWDHFEFMILELDVHTRGADWIFTFLLSWDDGVSIQPCEIAYRPEVADASMLN